MNGLKQIVRNLAGAWLLMLGKPDGLARIDTSIDGFWWSFAAIVLVAPFAYVAFLSQLSLEADQTAAAVAVTAGRLALNTIALLLDWIAFPLLFAFAARPFGFASRYVPFIVARNWASVIIGALMAVVHAIYLAGFLPATAMLYALLVATVIALRFSYLIARITLAASIAMALPIVILDFLLSLTIWSVMDRLS